MEEFNTIEKVEELFRGVNGLGESNCYFVALKDTRKNQGMIGGMEYPYTGLLINATEKGIGMFYLKSNGISFKITISKTSIEKDKYFFIPNEDIKSIIIKNYAIFNKNTKSIEIKTKDKKHCLFVNMNDTEIPYQIENFNKFMQKYQ